MQPAVNISQDVIIASLCNYLTKAHPQQYPQVNDLDTGICFALARFFTEMQNETVFSQLAALAGEYQEEPWNQETLPRDDPRSLLKNYFESTVHYINEYYGTFDRAKENKALDKLSLIGGDLLNLLDESDAPIILMSLDHAIAVKPAGTSDRWICYDPNHSKKPPVLSSADAAQWVWNILGSLPLIAGSRPIKDFAPVVGDINNFIQSSGLSVLIDPGLEQKELLLDCLIEKTAEKSFVLSPKTMCSCLTVDVEKKEVLFSPDVLDLTWPNDLETFHLFWNIINNQNSDAWSKAITDAISPSLDTKLLADFKQKIKDIVDKTARTLSENLGDKIFQESLNLKLKKTPLEIIHNMRMPVDEKTAILRLWIVKCLLSAPRTVDKQLGDEKLTIPQMVNGLLAKIPEGLYENTFEIEKKDGIITSAYLKRSNQEIADLLTKLIAEDKLSLVFIAQHAIVPYESATTRIALVKALLTLPLDQNPLAKERHTALASLGLFKREEYSHQTRSMSTIVDTLLFGIPADILKQHFDRSTAGSITILSGDNSTNSMSYKLKR